MMSEHLDLVASFESDTRRVSRLYNILNQVEPILARAASSDSRKAARGPISSHVEVLIERLAQMGTEQVTHTSDIARLDAILADVADEDAFRRIAEETAKGALQEVWQKMQAVWFRSETVQERLSALASLVLKLALPASICQQLLASSAVTSLKNFDDGFGDRAAQVSHSLLLKVCG